MLAAFLDDIRDHDMIAPRRMADRLRLPLARLARLAHASTAVCARPGAMCARPSRPRGEWPHANAPAPSVR